MIMKAWLKGGLIGLAPGIIVFLICIWHYLYTPEDGIFAMFAGAVYLGLYTLPLLLVLLVIFFGIGTIISWVIGKFRHKSIQQ